MGSPDPTASPRDSCSDSRAFTLLWARHDHNTPSVFVATFPTPSASLTIAMKCVLQSSQGKKFSTQRDTVASHVAPT